MLRVQLLLVLLAAGVARARPAWKDNFLWPLDVSKYQGHVSIDVPPGAKLFDCVSIARLQPAGAVAQPPPYHVHREAPTRSAEPSHSHHPPPCNAIARLRPAARSCRSAVEAASSLSISRLHSAIHEG